MGEGGLPVLIAKNKYSPIEIGPITGFSRIIVVTKKESYAFLIC